MNLSLPLPDWVPWWGQLAILVAALLFGFAFLMMPFAVFGVKGRLEFLETQLDDIHAELRMLASRLPDPERRPLQREVEEVSPRPTAPPQQPSPTQIRTPPPVPPPMAAPVRPLRSDPAEVPPRRPAGPVSWPPAVDREAFDADAPGRSSRSPTPRAGPRRGLSASREPDRLPGRRPDPRDPDEWDRPEPTLRWPPR